MTSPSVPPESELTIINLADYRKEVGVSVKDLAAATGLTNQRIYQIEDAGRCPTPTASLIAKALAELQTPPTDPKVVFGRLFYRPDLE